MIKKTIFLLTITLLIIVFVACDGKATSMNNDVNESFQGNNEESNTSQDVLLQNLPVVDSGDTRYISNHLDRLKIYSTFEELNEDSFNLITGICISSKPVFQNETLYTLSEIKVNEVFKGNISAGDTILIVEMGGRTTFGEYEKNCNLSEKSFEQGGERMPDDQKLVIGDDGYFPLQVNEEILLFTSDATGFLQDIKEPQYGIIGAYDGKLFIQDNGSYARPLPNKTDMLQFGEGTLNVTVDQLNAITK